jgi:hypothetical protein
MMYDDEYFYVAANVMDDMPGHFSDAAWAADAIEYYMGNWDIGDALIGSEASPGAWVNDGDTGEYSFQLNLQFDASEDMSKIYGYYGPDAEIESGDTEIAYSIWPGGDGYVLEAKIYLEDLVSMETGNEFEFIEGARYPFTWSLYDMDDTESSGDFKGYAYTKNGFPGHEGPSPGWQYADVKYLDFVDDWEINGPYPQANSVDTDAVQQPEAFGLSNYPNPFNPTTMLQIDLDQTGPVDLKVYDVTGQLVRTVLHNETRTAGRHLVHVDLSAQPSGVYVTVLESGSRIDRHKIMLVK